MTFYIGVEHPDLSVVRVGVRVREGGHPVPKDKTTDRYHRSGPLIRQPVLQSDVGNVFDNSRLNHPPPRIPDWVFDVYADDLII